MLEKSKSFMNKKNNKVKNLKYSIDTCLNNKQQILVLFYIFLPLIYNTRYITTEIIELLRSANEM